MKKFLVVLTALIITLPVFSFAAEQAATETAKEFVVYLDKESRQNHFIPAGWMGDYGDIKMNDAVKDNPHSGSTAIEFNYSAKRAQGQGWAGTYWQSSVNNWGNKKSGFDLTGMTKISFWARGAKGGEVIQKFVVGGIKGTYPDSTLVEVGPIELTDAWKQYTINLAGKDLSYLNGGFGWITTADLNPDGAVFYVDDIKFEADPTLKPEAKKQESMPFYVFADSAAAANHFIPSGYMGSFSDVKIQLSSKEDPYLGDTCIKIIYNNQATQAAWAGVYWQHPANNWGTTDAGYDLSKATKVTFWARGAKGGEILDKFMVGGIMGEFSDSDSAMIGPVVLNKEWTQYSIDLKGKDMSYVIGGFSWATNLDNNPEGATFYLDEIKYE